MSGFLLRFRNRIEVVTSFFLILGHDDRKHCKSGSRPSLISSKGGSQQIMGEGMERQIPFPCRRKRARGVPPEWNSAT